VLHNLKNFVFAEQQGWRVMLLTKDSGRPLITLYFSQELTAALTQEVVGGCCSI
jgi:hypothetical protein